MRKVIICLVVLLTFISCSKGKNEKEQCNEIATINGKKLEYDANGRLVKYATTTGDVTVTYSGDDKTIELKSATASAKTQLDNGGYVIRAELYDATDKIVQAVTYGRDEKEFITDEVLEVFKPDGTIDQRVAYIHLNNFDPNGNLVQSKITRTGFPPDSFQYEYDLTKGGLPFISEPGSLLLKATPVSKNLLIKERRNGVDQYLYTYTTDARNRVTYNKATPLVGTAEAMEAFIEYICN